MSFIITKKAQKHVINLHSLAGDKSRPVLKVTAAKDVDGLTYSFYNLEEDEVSLEKEQGTCLFFDYVDVILDNKNINAFDNVVLDYRDEKSIFYFSKKENESN